MDFSEVLKYYAIKYNMHLSSFTTLTAYAMASDIVFYCGLATILLSGAGTLLGVRKEFYDSETARMNYITKKYTFNLSDYQVNE
ncbi:MAG: hypothetical protein RIS64_4574 [Bacteroidota bacterium]|jgi:hypothetical protein